MSGRGAFSRDARLWCRGASSGCNRGLVALAGGTGAQRRRLFARRDPWWLEYGQLSEWHMEFFSRVVAHVLGRSPPPAALRAASRALKAADAAQRDGQKGGAPRGPALGVSGGPRALHPGDRDFFAALLPNCYQIAILPTTPPNPPGGWRGHAHAPSPAAHKRVGRPGVPWSSPGPLWNTSGASLDLGWWPTAIPSRGYSGVPAAQTGGVFWFGVPPHLMH